MSLVLHNDPNNQNLLSPGGMEGANDLFELGLEPVVDPDDDDDGNNVRALCLSTIATPRVRHIFTATKLTTLGALIDSPATGAPEASAQAACLGERRPEVADDGPPCGPWRR
jgi:hypothetical protein